MNDTPRVIFLRYDPDYRQPTISLVGPQAQALVEHLKHHPRLGILYATDRTFLVRSGRDSESVLQAIEAEIQQFCNGEDA